MRKRFKRARWRARRARFLAWVLVIISAVAAATAGVLSNEGLYALAAGVVLSAGAFVGARCPAIAARMAREGRGWWALVPAAAAVFAVVVSILGSVGTIKGGSADAIAKRDASVNSRDRAQGELRRKQGAREKLGDQRPASAIRADMTAAQSDKAYKASSECDPRIIQRDATRKVCDAYRKLEGELATAEAAATLDVEISDLNGKLDRTQGQAAGDAKGKAVELITRGYVPAEMASVFYAIAVSLMVELGAAAFMLYAELLTEAADREDAEEPARARREPEELEGRPQPARPANARQAPARVAPRPPAPGPKPGSVNAFFVKRVQPAKGKRVRMVELLAAFRAWCQAEGLGVLANKTLLDDIEELCERVGIEIEATDGDVFCVGIDLSA